MFNYNILLLCAALSLCVIAQNRPGSKIPQTKFTCSGRPAGYYADMETGCQVSSDDILCIECLMLLQERISMQTSSEASQSEATPAFGHQSICYGCGISIVSRRTHRVTQDCPQRNIILSWTPAHHVYHMCDGLGRQFSYTCPNTTLFQQRMLVCDHWYMVNCSMSERDYDANLLIGQRDKPFVSDEEMSQRTPRPDILSVPPKSNYYDGLKEAETKFPVHPGNSIVGVADTISSSDDGLDSAKQNYRPPTSWSTKKPNTNNNQRPNGGNFRSKDDNLTGAASQKPAPTIQEVKTESTQQPANITPPSRDLIPPFSPTTEAEDFQIDARMGEAQDPVFNFIKRFDPNSPDSHKTSMSRTEIININKELPEGQISAEEERTPKKTKNSENNTNRLQPNNDKSFSEANRFNSVNVKPTAIPDETTVPTPDRVLLPPKTDYSQLPTSTEGPPIYYEWKWAVPAFDLEPPKAGNETKVNTTLPTPKPVKNPFRSVTRSTVADEDQTPSPKNTEYNISSYFVPDYVFPLDEAHPGYDNEEAQTSFQVKVPRAGRSYGENPNCPHCHPAYLQPGTCEPCIVKR